MSQITLAIDFGTSNSLVGYVSATQKNYALPVDSFNSDQTMMRTLLYFADAETCYYGQQAIDEFIANDLEGRLFRSFKAHLPNQGYLGTVVDDRILSLENIVGLFLLELKKRAEAHVGQTVDRVVLGRPARYSMDEVADGFAIHRMQKAAFFAGFKEVQFVPEPLAAAFDFRRHANQEKIILIGDFGGGTSDFTVMKIHPGKFDKSDVLAIEGCPYAGDALDSVFMANKLNEYFGAKSKYRLPLSSNIMTMPPIITTRLNHPAHIVHLKDRESHEFVREVKKCALSAKDVAAIERLQIMIEDNQIFPFFEHIEKTKRDLSKDVFSQFDFSYPGIEISERFAVEQFVGWMGDIKKHIFDSLDRALAEAEVSEVDIDYVCLTGGTSKVPSIRAEFEKRFGAEKLQNQTEFHSVNAGLVEVAELWQNGLALYPIAKS